MVSAPVDADLLRAASWRMSNKLPFRPAWTPAAWGPVTMPGWREGNVVADPDGQLWDVLTFEARPLRQDVAAMVKIEDQPAGAILRRRGPRRFHPVSGRQGQVHPAPRPGIRRLPHPVQRGAGPGLAARPMGPPRRRDCASICGRQCAGVCASADLCRWPLLQDDSGLATRCGSPATSTWTGSSTATLIYVVRTAARGARNFHDSNRILFGRERGFRSCCSARKPSAAPLFAQPHLAPRRGPVTMPGWLLSEPTGNVVAADVQLWASKRAACARHGRSW